MELLIASNNQGKVKEIQCFLRDLPIKIYSLQEYQIHKNLVGPVPDPEENGDNYFENALIKAQAGFDWSGIPCLSDDSGLEVEALEGKPGLYSARYAGDNASFKDNIDKVLLELGDQRNRFSVLKTCLVYYDGKASQSFCGEVSGEILMHAAGQGGFGYDPIFKPLGSSQTLADLKTSVPDFPTHRMKALQAFKEFLFASELHKER